MNTFVATTTQPASVLADFLGKRIESSIILVDTNTRALVLPRLIDERSSIAKCPVIEIAPDDNNKTLESLIHVWSSLTRLGATRASTLICLGGGVVTDLGGFAAATFKRGINHINIATTLLGAVDAAIGGKTGINFQNLKNEIGAFAHPEAVIISPDFFDTLPHDQFLSGYAEMIKHSLIGSSHLLNLTLAYPLHNPTSEQLLELLSANIEVKQRIVAADPKEHGVRRALNLGHTAAHAFESLALSRGTSPLLHGVAVAWGLVVDMVLSHMLLKFPSATLHSVASFIAENYPVPHFSCNDYDELLQAMSHDKKNSCNSAINFTLLRNPGEIQIDVFPSADDIRTALDITRDLLHVP